jgi:hypothetical protein
LLNSHNYDISRRRLDDDGHVSSGYVQKRGAGGKLLIRRLRQIMHDALPCELPELAMPAPGAEFLAVVLFQLRRTRLEREASDICDFFFDSPWRQKCTSSRVGVFTVSDRTLAATAIKRADN